MPRRTASASAGSTSRPSATTPIASQTAERRCAAGPCSQSGPRAGDQVDQTAVSDSTEVTRSPTAMASKTSSSATASSRWKYRSMAPSPAMASRRGSATTAQYGVRSWSRPANAGQRRRRSAVRAKTGSRDSWAQVHGPVPTVNCSASAVAAASELAPSGIRRPPSPARLMPAPSTGSMRATARERRTGSSAGPSLPGAVSATSASSNRPAMLILLIVRASGGTRCTGPDAADPARRDHGAMAADQGMTVLPYGDRALLVEVSDLGAVAAVRTALEREPLAGQVDLVPAARTVLVLLDRAPAPTDTARLRRLPLTAPAGDGAGRPVDLPVVFDGPYLSDVAELTGRPVPRLIEELTGAELTVAFGGFAPGFGYLTGLPEELHVPRRSTPRTRVPAGAVGLVGPFAGAYPRPSPGGWQLAGRTRAPGGRRGPGAWPGRSPAPIRARRPGAGSWSAAPTPSCSTSTGTRR